MDRDTCLCVSLRLSGSPLFLSHAEPASSRSLHLSTPLKLPPSLQDFKLLVGDAAIMQASETLVLRSSDSPRPWGKQELSWDCGLVLGACANGDNLLPTLPCHTGSFVAESRGLVELTFGSFAKRVQARRNRLKTWSHAA